MGNVISRTQRDAEGALLQHNSVNTPQFSTDDWLINPDLSGVAGVAKYYWKVTGTPPGGSVVEMDAGEKAAVDATRLTNAKTLRVSRLQDETDEYVGARYPNSGAAILEASYIEAVRDRPNRASYIRPWIEWRRQVADDLKAKQDAVASAATVAEVEAIVLDTATLDAADPGITVNAAMAVADTTELTSFLDTNALVTDPSTGIKGPFLSMQVLQHRRALSGDSANPLDDGTVGVLPALGKGGWINDWIKQGCYRRPSDLLIYYGWPSAFNALGSNEAVAQAMAKYGLIVLGNGLENPAHGDYANTSAIITRVKALNPSALIFGYVSLNQAQNDFETKATQWNTLGVHGIFFDEAGYDYGKTRAEFNTALDYVHALGSANKAFANAWNTDNILGTANDPSYPNTTFNPGEVESNLTQDDWVLLESLAVNTTAYSASDGYASKWDWSARVAKAISLRATYKVNFASVGIIADADANAQDLFDFAFVSALMASLEANGTSDTSYGSGSAKTSHLVRPDTTKVGTVWTRNASIQLDATDADVYLRYSEFAKLSLDFSDGAQASSIELS